MTRRCMVAMAVMAVLATATGLGGCECPQIQQDVYVATPDATLAPLVEACRSGVPAAGQSCPSSTKVKTAVSCACLPLCRRVMELIDQFSGDETLISCVLLRSAPGAGGAGGVGGAAGGGGRGGTGAATDTRSLPTRPGTVEVAVTYRPSTCE
jgi:hypothetical protein